MKRLKNSLTIRGDSLYCPLPFSLDTYGNCLTDCWHCYFRRLNQVWDDDLKPADVNLLYSKLKNGLENPNPKSPLAWALKQKKTIKFGNKTDPFQEAERKYRVSENALLSLIEFKWSFVIQTKFTHIMMDYFDLLVKAKDHLIVMPVISPGLDGDWNRLERQRTTHPRERLVHLSMLKKHGISVGVNGEPFIPGYHTISDFVETINTLKAFGINRYNIYNLHFNDFVAKRLHNIGIDIEKIWYYNQDARWRPILRSLIEIAQKHNIILGCPDFVNSGRYCGIATYGECNTCCGISVPNPCTFNTHTWKGEVWIERFKRNYQPLPKQDLLEILNKTWDGVGDYELGKKVMFGETDKLFTMEDIKWD